MIKTKRYWVKRFAKIQNGTFMYFYEDNLTNPRKTIDIRNTIIQEKTDQKNKKVINLIITKQISKKDNTKSILIDV